MSNCKGPCQVQLRQITDRTYRIAWVSVENGDLPGENLPDNIVKSILDGRFDEKWPPAEILCEECNAENCVCNPITPEKWTEPVDVKAFIVHKTEGTRVHWGLSGSGKMISAIADGTCSEKSDEELPPPTPKEDEKVEKS